MTRKFMTLLSTVAVISGMVVLTTASSVEAAASASAARGDWVVTSINDQTCSMKNSFNSNVDLVFAKKASGEWSMAVDFHEDILEAKKKYYVDLSVGKAVDRQVESMATSNNVMIMRLGHDFEFFDFVRRKYEMGLSMPNVRVSFSLSGTSKALDEMENCVASLNLGQPFIPQNKFTPGVKQAQVEPEYKPEPEPALMKKQTETYIKVVTQKDLDYQREIKALQAKIDAMETRQAEKTQEKRLAQYQMENKEPKQQASQTIKTTNATEMNVTAPISVERVTQAQQAQQNYEWKGKTIEKPYVPGLSVEGQSRDLKTTSTAAEPITAATTTKTKTDTTMGEAIVPNLLNKLQVTSKTVTDMRQVEFMGHPAYQWENQGVFGTVHQVDVDMTQDLRDVALAHIGKMKATCPGEVSFMMGGVQSAGATANLIDADVVCLNPEGAESSSVAAVLFYQQGQGIAILSHEGTAERRHDILRLRDGYLNGLKS